MAEETPPRDGGMSFGNLNSILIGTATTWVKQELRRLTHEQDDALSRSHVPKLRALLREVDKERQAFEKTKEELIQGLRNKLQQLQVDPETIEAAVAEFTPLAPRYLGIIPSASTLAIRPPTPHMSPVRDNYFSTVLGAGHPSDSTPLAVQPKDQTPPDSSKGPCSSPANINVSPTTGPNIDHQVQSQILSENSNASYQTPKRSASDDDDDDAAVSAKRRKVDSGKGDAKVHLSPGSQPPELTNDQTPSHAQLDISRKVAFPNLETGERMFRHSERPGFYVIRCVRPGCSSGFFTEPPLAYNRALKHFEKHGETGPDGDELTNEYIFDKYACEIEGVNMVSKYWVKEHLGTTPHTCGLVMRTLTFLDTPGRTRAKGSQVDSPIARNRQEDDKNYTPSNKPRDVAINSDSEEEMEVEKQPRRTTRPVARPDYAELVANKDPWNLSDADSEAR
ncbi:hypothetical protein M426DRAFT_15400 [Hypoxylon sp. CI-4A]|nr:hypothetical protein M426DRAFT_15400 [Hypoxylon sp. CI-4A]